MSKKILILAPYPIDKAPSQRLKYEQYYRFFEEDGYSITTSSFIDEKFWFVIYKPGRFVFKFFYTLKGYLKRLYDVYRAPKYDLIYVHLWVTPFGPPIFENILRLRNNRIVYDIDDLIYLGEKSEKSSVKSLLKGKRKPISLMKMAKHVIVCTPLLHQFATKYNSAVTDISSTINTDIYKPRKHYEIEGKLVIGWSGSHSTSKYLYLLKDVFIELKKYIKFKLLVIGDATFDISGIEIEAMEWNLGSEVEDLEQIDIGLYPLPDEEWVYGKSGLKALQYMALGIPTLATAIGANFRVIENHVSGILIPPGESKGWVENIIRLYQDLELRRKIGISARERVLKLYSLKSNKDKYLKVLRSTCGSENHA